MLHSDRPFSRYFRLRTFASRRSEGLNVYVISLPRVSLKTATATWQPNITNTRRIADFKGCGCNWISRARIPSSSKLFSYNFSHGGGGFALTRITRRRVARRKHDGVYTLQGEESKERKTVSVIHTRRRPVFHRPLPGGIKRGGKEPGSALNISGVYLPPTRKRRVESSKPYDQSTRLNRLSRVSAREYKRRGS